MRSLNNEEIRLQSKFDARKNSYQIGLAENTNGDIFIFAVNSYMTVKTAQLEIWQSTDGGMNFKKICKPVELKIKGSADGEGTLSPGNRYSVGNRRNYSILDNIVPIVVSETCSEDQNFNDYLYYSVELPH